MWVYDGKALARLDAPSWQRGKELLATHPGKAVWQPDGKTLKLLAVEPIEGDHLRVETLYEDGTTGDPLSAPLEAPPARYRFVYEAMLPSPDGKRVLLHRTTSPVVIDADAGMFGPAPTPPPDQPPAANLLVDAETGHLEHVAPGVTPLGWLDAGRALVYTGRANAQDKVLSVVTL
jgi:hypothetical protein